MTISTEHAIIRENRQDFFKQIKQFAEGYEYEKAHAKQVWKLCKQILAQLQTMTSFSEEEREYLHIAALLHDIGVSQIPAREHHKTAQRIILNDDSLPLDQRERLIVANIVRYHRKALPNPKHQPYLDLSPHERKLVDRLSAILRIADGLDYHHESRVEHIQIEREDDRIVFYCQANKASIRKELQKAERKSDLFQRVYKCQPTFQQVMLELQFL